MRSLSRRLVRIGVDTGGTFTDFVIAFEGRLINKKILSTPEDPSRAIIEGIKEFLANDFSLFIIHGTTVATNALLERKGGPIALITTRGFEDILLIGRQTRRGLYRLRGETRIPLLPRRLCFGLEERTLSSGDIEKSANPAEVRKILKKIQSSKVGAVAVSLINSYANPANEGVVERELKKARILGSVSSRILPEHREFERTSTAAVNAYLMPVVNHYLTNLGKKIAAAEIRVMQSNEGYISPAKAKTEPIRTALSGPAGGVVAAARLARAAGFRNIISFDMGGTSTDVSLVDGRIRRTNESSIGEFPIRIPMIDIHSVGAGGGSIAFVDRGGSLRVGPQSAGADPGPACYGKGDFPTVTDANLYLGRLDPEFFLGGKMRIFPERSAAAIRVLSRTIGKPPLQTALGIIDIANANMEKAIRVISIERGFDPRSFSLYSFGGAGGMHAVEMMTHLQMDGVVVPRNAGVLSALGLLLADSVKDYSQSILRTVDKIRAGELERRFAGLGREAMRDLQSEGFKKRVISLFPSLDLRYLGQSYEINVPCDLTALGEGGYLSDFHREHQKLYSYHHPQRPVEVVNIRVKAVGSSRKIRLSRLPEKSRDPARAMLRKQPIYYGKKEHRGVVFDRTRLEPGNTFFGPALVVDPESTTFLPPGYRLRVDGYLNLIIHEA